MKEKLLEMLEMQKALNESILKEHGSEKYTEDNLYHALLDEIGELNHELKAEWCWWKNTQKPVDRDKVLEEYVDCIHFGLCLLLKHNTELDTKLEYILNKVIVDNVIFDYDSAIKNAVLERYTCASIINALLDDYWLGYKSCFAGLLLLGNKLGFSFNTIYEAYIKKNKVNYERLKNGY